MENRDHHRGGTRMNLKSSQNQIFEKFRKNREQILFVFAVSFCVFTFTLSLIRAAVTAVTYDEASTYLRYYQEDFFAPDVLYWYFSGPGCIANNHWLNSFLIWILGRITGIRFSEFMVRLPILVLYAVYLFTVCRSYKKKVISFPVLILLVGNYYLHEFYGLARGYGMANTFVFLFCLSYMNWKQSDFSRMRYLNFAMIWAVFAVLSNTIVLLLYPAVGILCLYRLISKKQFRNFLKNCSIVFAGFLAVTVLMVIYHFNISAPGKMLYTGGHNFFDNFVKGYIEMFVPGEPLRTIISIAVTALVLLAVLRINKGMKELDFGVMMFLFILTNLIIHPLTAPKGYIATRVLLPFYAFMVLAVNEIIQTAFSLPLVSGKGIPVTFGKYIAAVLCALCVCIFVSRIDLDKTKDWKNDYRYRTLEIGSDITGVPHNADWGHPSGDFYIKKDEAIVEEFYSYLR